MGKKRTLENFISLVFVISISTSVLMMIVIASNVEELPYHPIYSIILLFSGILAIGSWITILRSS